MKKNHILAVFALMFFFFAAVSCDKSDPPPSTNDKDEQNDDSNQEKPDSNNNKEDCNYSSTDNRLRPKNEEVFFSGMIFGEKSLTKYAYVMNRCYSCSDSMPLIISKVAIVNEEGFPDEGSFKIEINPLAGGPVSLKNDEEIGIGISVVASSWEEEVRYLRVSSNDKCKPDFDIKLTAQTKPSGKIVARTIDDDDPDDGIMVFKDVLDELINRVEVTNVGIGNLKLSAVTITQGKSKGVNETGFFISQAPDPNVYIAPAESTMIMVGCRNDKEFPHPLAGELLISNSDPTEYGIHMEKKIALKCGPNVDKVPTAKLKCEPEKISVLQWATMDGGESVDSDGVSKADLRYLWSFKSTPGGISLDIVDDSNRAGSPLNNDPSNKISRAAFQAKMKGLYTVRLIVANDKGVSSLPAECDVEAISDDDLAVKLLWDNKNADMDVHLVSPGGAYGDPLTDCYYWNCSPQYSGERPDWGVAGDTKDDPYLDIDNTTGMGPETLYINKPANGSYKVVIHAYDTSKGPTTAVVKAYAHAVEVSSKSLLMTRTDTCWDVYTIDVSDGSGNKKDIVVKEIVPAQAYDCKRPFQ
ncbi:MAG: YfaP family protein [bacterium]